MNASVNLHQFLVLYMWFPLAILLTFMLLIGRFYQKFSGERTYFWLYAVAIVLFGVIAVRSVDAGVFPGEFIADTLSGVAGLLLIGLSIVLYRRMITENHAIQS